MVYIFGYPEADHFINSLLPLNSALIIPRVIFLAN